MHISGYPSKGVAFSAISLFFLFLVSTSFPATPAAAQQKPGDLAKEGLELYKSGEYDKAVEKLTQAADLAEKEKPGKKRQELLSDVYFYLSLCYFSMGDTEKTKESLQKSFQAEPKRIKELSSMISVYPSEYISLFTQVSSEVGVPTVVGRETKRPGAGIKFGRIALIGAAVVGAAAAGYFLWIKPDTGEIQVNSTPTGAQIFLNGADTGKKTNVTLTDITPGEHAIKLVKDGYADFEQNLSVSAGKTATLNASLSVMKIRITKPAAGSTWVRGQTVEIKWETGTGSSLNTLGRAGRFFNPADGSSYLRRMSAFQARSVSRRGYGKRGTGEEGFDSRSALAGGDRISGLRRGEDNAMSSSTGTEVLPPEVSSQSRDWRAQGLYRLNPLPSQAPGVSQQSQVLSITGNLEKTGLLDIAKVKIEVYRGSTQVETVESSTDNDGTQNWTIPNTFDEGTDYKVKISCVSDAKISGESGSFTITEAKITITQPASGAFWGKGETKDIQWTSTVSGNVRIELLKGTSPYLTIADGAANNGAFSWLISPDLEEGMDYRIRVTLVSDATVKGDSPSLIVTKLSYEPDMVATGFTAPHGIAVDQTNYAHVVEATLNQVSKFLPASGAPAKSTFGGTGSGDGQFNQPKGIVADTTGGFIYVVDSGNHRIQKFDTSASGTALSIKGGPTAGSGNGEFDTPYDIAVDNSGNVYVTDRNNKRVQKFSAGLTWLQNWPISGDPLGIACDSYRNSAYVVDYAGRRILVYSLNGTLSKSWSVAGLPKSIAVDKSGFLYITDVENHRFLKYTPDGLLLCAKGSYGDAYHQLKRPADICVDSLGRVLVTSNENNRIHRFK